MVAAKSKVVEVSWDDMIDGNFPEPEPIARRVFRETLAEVCDKAKQALQASNGRVDKAVQIVLSGDVVPCEDGRFFVGSQSDPKSYIVLENACDCPDSDKAPEQLCKHVIATMLWRRTYPLAQERMAALDRPQVHEPKAQEPAASALPEAPASVNVYVEVQGRKVQVTLRDSDEARLLGRLRVLLAQFPAAQEEPEPPEGWCSIHDCQMKHHTNTKGSWWSHKTADGWCRGR